MIDSNDFNIIGTPENKLNQIGSVLLEIKIQSRYGNQFIQYGFNTEDRDFDLSGQELIETIIEKIEEKIQ